jgi:V/A-type H+-transporting ATPase subunit F
MVTGFRLAGVEGVEVTSPQEALEQVERLVRERDVGLILVGDDVAKPIRDRLTTLRSRVAVPLIYEAPAPGSSGERMAYRDMLKQLLGVEL